MGTTIDKAIDRLEDLHFEQDDWEYGELTDDCLLNREALRLAISTMRKYQKIEEIVSDFREYQKGISCGFGGATYMQMVSEVVEDGKKVVIDGDKTKNVRGNRAKELLDHISTLFTKEAVITMLTELHKEIEELDTPNNGSAYMDCSDIIQQKIDSLKGEEDAKIY